MNTYSSVSSSKLLNKLNNFQDIFSHNKRKDTSILLLKKKEYDIFYSCKHKYPLLVAENVSILTGKTDPSVPAIDRSVIIDPFRLDIDIPEKNTHSLNDYETSFMQYGISMGHNAAAGQHKTNLDVYYETFLLSNITPQEMVFNSGLWVLFETWCKYLGSNNKVTNIKIFTGSIPDDKLSNCNDVKINIPIKMFKIVCFELSNKHNKSRKTRNSLNSLNTNTIKPRTTYCDIFISNNAAYYINPKTYEFELNKFIIPTVSHNWFQNFSGIDIKILLKYYGYNCENIKSFRNIISTKLSLSPALRHLMKKSMWYGYLIYSPTIEHLETVWDQCKTLEDEFKNLDYHLQFYEKTKTRLIRDNGKISNIKLFNNSINLFTKIFSNLNSIFIKSSKTSSKKSSGVITSKKSSGVIINKKSSKKSSGVIINKKSSKKSSKKSKNI